MFSFRALVGVALILPVAAACDRQLPPTATEAPPPTASAGIHGHGFGVFSASDLVRQGPRDPCGSERHRDFDFWLGDWNVLSPTQTVVATNRILSDLDGCALLENWTAGNGTRGRSLNAYDATTGLWNQMWVAPNPFSPLRISGVKENGVLEMSGVRVSPFGFSVIDTIRWQAISADVVRQAGTKNIPGFSSTAFSIDYHRTDDVQPVAEVPATQCQAGGPAAENRMADFLIGSWGVHSANGRQVAHSEIESDLSGCLFVERITSPQGFASLTFFHYDAVTDKWTRGTMDNLGQWQEMTGPVDHAGGPIVLTGTRGGPGLSTTHVRLTIESVGAAQVQQTLETSQDGGATWPQRVTLDYRM
jgi:hypothetical protein